MCTICWGLNVVRVDVIAAGVSRKPSAMTLLALFFHSMTIMELGVHEPSIRSHKLLIMALEYDIFVTLVRLLVTVLDF